MNLWHLENTPKIKKIEPINENKSVIKNFSSFIELKTKLIMFKEIPLRRRFITIKEIIPIIINLNTYTKFNLINDTPITFNNNVPGSDARAKHIKYNAA